MASSIEGSNFEDDLSRQRRKREARLLDQPVTGFPGFTVADVVAEVLAASDEGRAPFNVPVYLAEQGHDWPTIDAVVGYLRRQGLHPPGPADAAGAPSTAPTPGAAGTTPTPGVWTGADISRLN